MGPGLADGLVECKAGPADFRTPPLCGVGASGPPYLHDGRARDLAEAIGLHDGEALNTRLRWERLSAADREALIRYLQSLSEVGLAGAKTRSAVRPISCVIAASNPPATTPPTTGTSRPSRAAPAVASPFNTGRRAACSAFLNKAGDSQPSASRVILVPSRTPASFSVSAAFEPVMQASAKVRTSALCRSWPRRCAIA